MIKGILLLIALLGILPLVKAVPGEEGAEPGGKSSRYKISCPPKLEVIGSMEVCQGDSYEGVILYVSPGCGDDSFNQQAIRFDTIKWYRDDQLLKGENDSTLHVTKSGKYSVVTIINNVPGDYIDRIDTNIILLSASTPPETDWMVTLPSAEEYCRGRENRIGIEPLENIMYIWRKDGVLLPDQHSPEIYVNEDGLYEVKIRNACGESPAGKTFSVLIKDTPAPPEIKELKLPCGPGMAEVTLSDEVTGIIRWYDWEQRLLGKGFSIIGLEIKETTRIYVDQVVDGCSSDMKVIGLPLLESYPVKIGDFTVSASTSLRIEPADVPEQGTFRWLPDDGQLQGSDTRTPVFYPGSEADYQYILEYTSPQGCMSKDSTHIHVVFGYKIPAVITPNGDGHNDLWVIEGLQVFPDNEVVIYDRKGQVVYQAKPYRNDWNGTSETGDMLPPGSYVYKISGFDKDPVCGMVSVIRK